jgi:hypothetical protein
VAEKLADLELYKGELFCHDNMIKFLVLLKKQTSKQKTEIDLYISFVDEFLKFCTCFGSILGFAFGEVNEKKASIIANRKTLINLKIIKEGSEASIYIEDFCKVEI